MREKKVALFGQLLVEEFSNDQRKMALGFEFIYLKNLFENSNILLVENIRK